MGIRAMIPMLVLGLVFAACGRDPALPTSAEVEPGGASASQAGEPAKGDGIDPAALVGTWEYRYTDHPTDDGDLRLTQYHRWSLTFEADGTHRWARQLGEEGPLLEGEPGAVYTVDGRTIRRALPSPDQLEVVSLTEDELVLVAGETLRSHFFRAGAAAPPPDDEERALAEALVGTWEYDRTEIHVMGITQQSETFRVKRLQFGADGSLHATVQETLGGPPEPRERDLTYTVDERFLWTSDRKYERIEEVTERELVLTPLAKTRMIYTRVD